MEMCWSLAQTGTIMLPVFYRDQGGSNLWGQVKKLVASDGQSGVDFGSAVSVSGEIITVGASLADSKGAVFVYQRNAGGPDQWAEVKKPPHRMGSNTLRQVLEVAFLPL